MPSAIFPSSAEKNPRSCDHCNDAIHGCRTLFSRDWIKSIPKNVEKVYGIKKYINNMLSSWQWNLHYMFFEPRQGRCGLEHSLANRKVECSNPSRDGPKSVIALLPNAQQ